MHPVLEEMNRYATRHREPEPIQGRVLRRWTDTLIDYIAELEAEIATLKTKKGRAA